MPFRCHTAGGHFERWRAEVLDQMAALCCDIAVIDIDQDNLHLRNMLRACSSRLMNCARHDKERHPRLRSPVRLMGKLDPKLPIHRQKWRMRRRVIGTLFRQCSDRCKKLAIPKHHIYIKRDRIRVWDNRLSHINCLYVIAHAQHLVV